MSCTIRASGFIRSRVNSQPMWLWTKPSMTGECGSSGVSECLWCRRWWMTHHSGPFWSAVQPAAASRNWNQREVLNAWCAKYRWNPAVMPRPANRVTAMIATNDHTVNSTYGIATSAR